MALFLAKREGNIHRSLDIQDLYEELDEMISEQAAYMRSDEYLSLLAGIDRMLCEEKAWEDRFVRQQEELLDDIAAARSISGLETTHKACRDLAEQFFVRRGSALTLNQFCTTYRDVIVRKSVGIAEEQLGTPSAASAWCATGNFGRSEATLTTPCDLLLVYNVCNSQDRELFRRLHSTVESILTKLGLHEGVDSFSSATLHDSISGWRERIATATDTPGPLTETVSLCDLRLVAGSRELCGDLRSAAMDGLNRQPYRIMGALRSAASMPLGFDFFGRLKTEKSGLHRGSFNLLQSALLPLILTVRILSISGNIPATSTHDRIRQLLDKRMLGVDLSAKLIRSYHDFVRCKVKMEIDGKGNEQDGFYLDPDEMSEDMEFEFKHGLDALLNLQRTVFQTIEA